MALNPNAGAGESVQYNAQDLREYYQDDEVKNMVLGEGPLYGLMPKYNKFSGKNYPVPMIYGDPQGASATFGVAKANKTNSQEASFFLVRSKDYALASVEREAKLASEIDRERGAWLELAKIAVDGALNQATRSLAISMYRDGTGIRGQVSATSNVTTTLVTLSDINDVSNFEVYQYVQFSAARTGSVRTGQAQIVAVDRNAGTLTFGAALNSLVATVAAGDYICRAGDFGAVMPGLASYLVPPNLRPTAAGQDLFYGQDRFPDMTRLMGVYHNGVGSPIDEAMIDLERKCARENARVTHMFLNNVQYGQALKALSGRVIYTPVTESARSASGVVAKVSFSGIEFQGAGGPVRVFPDFNCPSTKLYALTLPLWKLVSLNDAPHIFDLDTDQEWLRHDQQDNYEVRTGSYCALLSRAPGMNGVADLSPAV